MDERVPTEELIRHAQESMARAMAALDRAQELVQEIIDLCSSDSAELPPSDSP